MNIRNLLTLIGVAFFACGVQAASLADKKVLKEAEAKLTEDNDVKSMNTLCGTSIKLTVDWASFEKNFKDSHNHKAAANYCISVADGVRKVCESGADEKKEVSSKIKGIKCSFKADANKFAADLSGTTVHAFYNWETGNIADETKAWVMGKL